MTLAQTLDAAVRAVCSHISSTRIGVPTDKSTWQVEFTSDATQQERDAAAQVIAAFDLLIVVKSEIKTQVDVDAERVRLRYITPGAGMVMTYQEKFAQAQSVAALGQDAANALTQQQRDTQFPTLSASVGIEAATLWDCAQLVLQKYAQFAALSRLIETARLAGKKAISDAPDEASARAAYDAITWPAP